MSRITEKKMSLKLLIDKKGKKVMFAEVEKEFVDFIFHIMSLPLSTVTRLLTEKQMVGCLGDLYKSIDSLNNHYFESNCRKDAVLKPQFSPFVPLLCNSNNNASNSNSLKDINNSANFQGFVKEAVTYMVMDSLEVKPMSMSTVMSLNIDIGSLEERNVQFGLLEGIAMLEASMKTKNVLTAVFLKRQSHLLSVGDFGWFALTTALVGAFIFTVAFNIFGGSYDHFKPT